MTHRIAMWSGPRNLSTALMRSFGARADTMVSNEPFYGAYLRHAGNDQLMKDEVIASMDSDWQSVARTLAGPAARPIWYQKHMAHHMAGPVDIDDLAAHTHAFLIRDPARVVASYAAKRIVVRPDDLGVARQRAFFGRHADRLGEAPPVVDAADILANPPVMLASLCPALGIVFDPAMLAWPAGRRETDGLWGAHLYDAVAASTGFGPPDTRPIRLDAAAQAVADACRADYASLASHRIYPPKREVEPG